MRQPEQETRETLPFPTYVTEPSPFPFPFLLCALQDLDKLTEVLLVLANGLADLLQLGLQLLRLFALGESEIGRVRV